ncbi:MAG: Adaptive-response sensory-kinase SasA [Chroococcopsis gigantea SAG 12.99]|nr:Adaptive-response sensory-kinase SasA [Chroococcopsis gigantea SAG 12.99]
MKQKEGAIERVFPRKSEMGLLGRSLNWSATPLGAVTDWEQSLKTSVNMCLNCPFPAVVWWGEQFVSFYNDACQSLLGNQKYSSALGQKGESGWSRIWHLIAPQLEEVRWQGEPQKWDKQKLSPCCGEIYYEVSHSPIFDDSGDVGGVFTVFKEIVEPGTTETQLLKSKHFIEKVTEALPEILYVYDLIDQRNVYVNKQISNLLGYTEEWVREMGANLLPTLLHQEDLAGLPGHLGQFISVGDGEIIELEYRMQHANGEWRWFHCREVVFSRTEAGLPQEILGVSQDITEEKNRELVLRASEERFRLVTGAVNGLVFDWDLTTGQIYRSEQLYELLGFHPADVPPTANWWYERIHPEDMTRLDPQVGTILTSNQVLSEGEYRVRHQNGHWVYVWERCSLIRDEKGEVVRILGCTVDISARVRDQTQLRLITETIPQQIWTALPTGEIDYINPRLCDRFGITLEETRCFGWAKLIHPENLCSLMSAWKESLESGCFFQVETRVLCVDGEYRWFLAQAMPLHDEAGEIVKWYGTNTEIDDRVRAEANLRESEAKLQQQLAEVEAIYQTAPIGLTVLDRDLRYLRINQRLAEINGLSRESHMGRVVADVLPELSSTVEPLLRSVIDQGEPLLNLELHGETPAQPGVERVWLEHFVPLKNGDETTAISIVCEEITDRIKTELALRESEARLKQLVDLNFVGVMFWNIDGRVLDANDAFLNTIGYTRSELEAGLINWRHMTPPEQMGLSDASLARMRINSSDAIEKEYIRKDGRRVPVLLGGVLFKDSHELGVSFVVDMTEQKRTERYLQESEARLKQRNQELDRFVYTVSHDLKAPLRAIANLTDWLAEDLEGQLDEDNLQQMQLLQNRVIRMSALIDGLLVYSRIGRTEVATENVNVRELIAEVIDSLAPPPEFTIRVDIELIVFPTKRLLLSQVLSNLIGNAVKHNDRPDGQIGVSVRPDGDAYLFSVADNGPGIAAENHERIFAIFQTLKSRDVQENTGLGLSIVKKIVENEGGSIWLESSPGEGTVFYFIWPVSH